MHHRAFSLLTSRASVSAPANNSATSFSLALQTAAARAWTRQISTKERITNGVALGRACVKIRSFQGSTNDESLATAGFSSSNRAGPSAVSEPCCSKPSISVKRSCIPTYSKNEKPKKLSTYEDVPRTPSFINSDPLLSAADVVDAEPAVSEVGGAPRPPCFVTESVDLHQTPPLSEPATHQVQLIEQQQQRLPPTVTLSGFYQNLLRMVYSHKPPLSLPVIIDYHNLHPEFHSARSYNLVLSLALRHCAFGTFRNLLSSMRASRLERNMETWKLEIRWLVQTGSWGQAWKQVTDPRNRYLVVSGNSKPYIPLPIWLEFFHVMKRGHVPRGSRTEAGRSPIAEDSSGDTKAVRYTQKDSKIWDPRLKLLFERAPSNMADLRRIKPFVIRGIVSHLLRLKHEDLALMFTKAYLRALPRRLKAKWRHDCTDIINLHVALGSSSRGLRKLWDTQKTLNRLLRLHPSVRPNSTTLFHLLSPLLQAKRCGTVARVTTRAFVSMWGKETQDRRVERRIVALALKEGRLDIANEYANAEGSVPCSRQSQKAQSDDLESGKASPRKRLRGLSATLFAGKGRERKLWHRLIRRARRMGLSGRDE